MSKKSDSRKVSLAERIRPWPALPIIAAVGLLLRLFFMRYRFAVAFDEVNYLKLGVSGYLNGLGDILHTYWSPLLPALISFSCHFFEDYELAGRTVSMLAGTALVIPIYFLGKFVYDKNVGILAAGFVAIFPPLAFQATQVLTEPVYMLSGTCAMLFGLRMLKRYSAGFALLVGIFSGLAYLAHPQGIGFLIMLLFWVIFASLSKRFLIRPVRVIWLTVPLIFAFLSVSAPYLLYLKHVTGRWTLSAKANANMQMDAPKNGVEDPFRSLDHTNKIVPIDQIFHQGNFLQSTDGGRQPVREVRFWPFVSKYVKNVADVLKSAIPELLTTIPMILLGVGLVGRSWQAQQGIMVVYLISFIGFFWFVLIPSFHINLRYFTPLLPICSLWIARGAIIIHEWLSTHVPLSRLSIRKRMSSGGTPAVIVLVAFLVLSFLPEFGRVISRNPDSNGFWADPIEQKKAGLWLKENANGSNVIMSRNHAVDFYAGNYDITGSVTIPKNRIERVLEYARSRNANYLVLNERYKESYPEISFLLEAEDAVQGLQLVYDETGPSGLKTRIYRLL